MHVILYVLLATIPTTCVLDILFSSVGDYMPHKQALHLPSMLTVKAVYERMQLDLGQTVSQAQFYKLWNQNFPQLLSPL